MKHKYTICSDKRKVNQSLKKTFVTNQKVLYYIFSIKQSARPQTLLRLKAGQEPFNDSVVMSTKAHCGSAD